MRTTHKQTITFTEPQAAYLKTKSEALGISFADLIRRIVDTDRSAPKEQPDPYRKGTILGREKRAELAYKLRQKGKTYQEIAETIGVHYTTARQYVWEGDMAENSRWRR